MQQTEFFVILDRFLPFYPPKNPKHHNFEKTKQPPGDIIILHRCNITDNHIMYDSWDTKCDRQNFFVILDHFLLFYPPNNLKNQNFEKMKKSHTCEEGGAHLRISFWHLLMNLKNK